MSAHQHGPQYYKRCTGHESSFMSPTAMVGEGGNEEARASHPTAADLVRN